MSGLRDFAKGGWHPKGKDSSGKESWRGDFKGVSTVAGWMGKGKGPGEAADAHQSAPLSTLRDPASFGPPPKRADYQGTASPSATSSASTPGGLGAPLPPNEASAKQRLQARREAQARAEEEANRPPPGPYRADTTGLSTAGLPPPPVFRPRQGDSASSPNATKPKLPPRLPPRQNSRPDAHSEPPPPPYSPISQDSGPSQGILNQGAISRLGKAGVSVPGFDIGGRNPSPPIPPRQTTSPAPVSPSRASNRGPQLSELQSRFARISTSPTESQTPTTGTSWADKRAALKTANDVRNNPGKVSLSEMRSAASTANNFRERHSEQAAAGWRTASGVNQKYGITERANSYGTPVPPSPQSPSQSTQSGLGKRPPPPPPPKKKQLSSNAGEPPPIPTGSKPRF